MRQFTLISQAKQLLGPGTSVIWRPEGYPRKYNDGDTAIILHVSTDEDEMYASAALLREQEKIKI